MNFNGENMGKYNVIKVKLTVKCSVCNKETNYVDYWSDNKFCSTECLDKYYGWLKQNKSVII